MSKKEECLMHITRRQLLIGASLLAGGTCAKSNASQNMYKIGVVFPIGSNERIRSSRLFKGLMSELQNLGYDESKNLRIEIYSADAESSNYLVAARNAIAGNPDVIFVSSIDSAMAIKDNTKSIPIVACVDAPRQNNFIPENGSGVNNITGVDVDLGTEFYNKRLNLLREAGCNFIKPAFLTPSSFDLWKRVEALRHNWGGLVPVEVKTPLSEEKVRIAFAHMMEDGADALVVGNAPVLALYPELIAQLSNKYGLPAIYPYRSYVDAGGLISFGVNFFEAGRVAAGKIQKILMGVSPLDIPFSKISDTELIVNLRAMKYMNQTIAESVIRRANLLIE